MGKNVQGTLFEDSVPELGEAVGYRTSVVCKVTGLTQRQIDHWASTGVFEPTLLPAKGSGTRRLYTFKDIVILQVFKKLLDTGISLQKIRIAKDFLKSKGINDLSSLTLGSDGKTILMQITPEEIIDLLKGGQGVFAISVGTVWSEVEGSLKEFKPSTIEEEMIPPSVRDAERFLKAGSRV